MKNLEEQITTLLGAYAGTPTHTTTALERNNQTFFEGYFSSVPYFQEHPEHCGFYPIPGDALGRTIPWALLKGRGKKTIVLIHHSDTVDTDDYGRFQELATQPQQLTEAYFNGGADLDADAQKDLSSGQWLFGRGVADMKGGAAVHLALLAAYAQDKDFAGNLLLLGLPDEENLSAGMRSAVQLLTQLQETLGLQYALMLNGEPQERSEDNLMRLYDGSVGKLMPLCYVRGKLAHVGQVFRGLNPIHLLSEIITATELNPWFSEHAGNTQTPPPTWLFAKDRKEVYDVSLPLSAAGYMSILTLQRPAMEIMEQLQLLCQQAFERVLARSQDSYRQYTKDINAALPWKVNVKTYAQVYQEALADAGNSFESSIKAYEKEVSLLVQQGKLSMAEAAFRLIEKTVSFLNDANPLVVLAMSPPYYPHVNNTMLPQETEKIDGLLAHLQAISKEQLACDFHVKNYYTGISDLSYSLFESDQANIDFIKDNMLLWGDTYSIPFEEIKNLSIPVLNIGPWGKDFHKYSERVNLPDLTQRIPTLVQATIEYLLGR